jgi:hypothetical protein
MTTEWQLRAERPEWDIERIRRTLKAHVLKDLTEEYDDILEERPAEISDEEIARIKDLSYVIEWLQEPTPAAR